jgi:glycosyltransferase involved in cell wall biosynthesis
MTQHRTNYLASIVIPTYNKSALLTYTLDSLMTQSVDYRLLEIIVVDDGSTDSTTRIIRAYKNKMHIKYFYQEDKGYRVATARNVGIENASSDIVILMDSGVILNTTCIDDYIQSYRFDQEPAAMIGYVYGLDQENATGGYRQDYIEAGNPEAWISRLEEEYDWQYEDGMDELPAPGAFFRTCTGSVKKIALDIADLFDEHFYLNGRVEELELEF